MTRLLKSIFQHLYPYATFRTGRDVFITFDDGPIPEVTPQVLEILERYGIKATFFMVGENIDKHTDVFEQVVKAGHSIGNHTYNHLKGWRFSTAEYIANVQKWEDAVKRQSPITNHQLPITNHQSPITNNQSPITNHQSPITNNQSPLFRPPYGKATLRQRIALHKKGYRLIYWDIMTHDYNPRVTPEQMLRRVQRGTRPGSIINFHDSLKSNERMLEVLPQVIEWLQKEGYELAAL